MIVDMRTRLSAPGDPRRAARLTDPEAFAEAMTCVDVAVAHGMRCDRLGAHVPAETIAAFVHTDPQRRAGFVGLDPSSPSWQEDLDSALDLGLIGATIAPADQGLRPTHDACLRTLERCASKGAPVLVANPLLREKGSVLAHANPALFEEAIAHTPGLTLVLGDLGWGWLDEALLLAAKHERVYAELSGVVCKPVRLLQTLVRASELGVLDKLLFGSGFPDDTPQRSVERIYSINATLAAAGSPSIAREKLRQIVERNTLAELGIDHLGARRPARQEALPEIAPKASVPERA